MKIEIDEKILTKTNLCEREFSCLQNGANDCCKVEHFYANRYLFVKCIDSKRCSYKTTHNGSVNRCACPTRIEIYKKYGL